MKVGDRVRMIHMPDDPNPIPSGTEGVVTDITRVQMGPRGERSFTQISVDWDNGRTLRCVSPPDTLAVIASASETAKEPVA